MILKKIQEQLTEAGPVSKIIKSGDAFKSLAIGLKKGSVWRDHKAILPTKLVVVQGAVLYRQEEVRIRLEALDDMDIPVDITHSLEAWEDSICILIQG